MTTLHGFRYISEKNRSLLEKIFWLLAIISAHYFCGIVISELIHKWNTSSVILTLDTKPLSIVEIPFPAITICSDDQIRATVFPFEERLNLKEHLNATEKMKTAAAQLLCGSYHAGNENYVDKSIFRSIIKETAPQLTEIVEAAYYLQDSSNSLLDEFQPLFTRNGLCYTFNTMPFSHLLSNNFNNVLQELGNSDALEVPEEKLWDMDDGYRPGLTGESYPIRLSDRTGNSIVFTLKYNETEHDNTCTQGSTGFTIYVHSPVELPAQYHSITHVEPGTKTDVYITPNIINTRPGLQRWTPNERGCYFSHEKPLIFFKIYTQFNCDSECRSLMELRACGCVKFYHPRNSTTPICGPNKRLCLWNIFNITYQSRKYVQCDCLPSCSFIDYEIDYQYKPYIGKEESSFTKSLSITNENETEYTVLSFSYKVKSVYATKRAALLTLSDFIAQIGGTLSLFLGFSFLSLFEIIYYITIRIFVNYWNKRKRNFAVHNERKIEDPRLKNQPSSTIYF